MLLRNNHLCLSSEKHILCQVLCRCIFSYWCYAPITKKQWVTKFSICYSYWFFWEPM